MTSRTRRLAFTAGFVVLFALTLWSWIPDKGLPQQKPASAADDGLTPAHESGTSSADETSAPSESSEPTGGRVGYAIGLHDIAGLPRDVAPGTVADLWVAWDPPVRETPEFRLLMRSAVVEEIKPPFVPEGPFTVMLSVPKERFVDLLYADRYGAISVGLPR